MAGEHRTTLDSVAQTLTEMNEQIGSFDFVAAVRQLECAYPDKPRVGDAARVRDDVVRLSQHVNLGFQGRALHSLERTSGAHDYRLYVNFLGLLGSNGPMPLHYTEYADQRTRHNADPTFKEFLDLFNHRLLSLFYRASVQFDPAVSFDRSGNNPYADVLGALCGLLPEASANRDSIADSAKRHYPGWMASSAKSPDGIKAILSDYFELPFDVREWVGAWLPLPASSVARLGSGDAAIQLGRSAHLGKRVWSIRHKFQISMGPLDLDTFSSFRPGSKRAKALHDLVRNYIGDEWDWDLELVLSAGERQAMALNHRSSLGFDSWIVGKSGRRFAVQTVLLNKKLISHLAH